jgi:hypothetical protein
VAVAPARGDVSKTMARSVDQLPDPPPSLDPDDAKRLRAMTEAALQSQRRELAASLERALGHIPRPLRGAVRRAVGL